MARPDPATLSPSAPAGFSARVRDCFGRGAAGYERGARLQAGIAHRLGRLCRGLSTELPPGARADLGAGSGLLSRALEAELPGTPLLRVDQCSDLLAQDRSQGSPVPQLLWDLNDGLPRQLRGAALLASSFTLQWLAAPEQRLAEWCEQLAPGGWLVLAVPTAGSFRIWHQAAQAAGVPFSGLEMPDADALATVAGQHLRLRRVQRLPFSRQNRGGLALLRQIKAIGAQASPQRRLSAGELRRLLQHWPTPDHPLNWELLLLIGQR